MTEDTEFTNGGAEETEDERSRQRQRRHAHSTGGPAEQAHRYAARVECASVRPLLAPLLRL